MMELFKMVICEVLSDKCQHTEPIRGYRNCILATS